MSPKNGTVLVVDDSPIIAHQLYEVLHADYRVLVATSGAEGIELATMHRPDLVLLDVGLPELNGYEVCQILKEDVGTIDIPVIFITARDEADDEERGLSLGAIDYLTKPLRPALVRARVKNHIELKRNRDLLLRLTTVDPLTGIANRRRFDEYAATEWSRAGREGASLAVLMIDVDDFKRYNDSFGHALGDQCLRRVACTLQNGDLRSGDLVARYGGEEFVCVLPRTDLAAALQIGERLRAAIEGLAIAHNASRAAAHVTISVGAAARVPDGEPVSDLVRAADAALYEAKHGGRNQVAG